MGYKQNNLLTVRFTTLDKTTPTRHTIENNRLFSYLNRAGIERKTKQMSHQHIINIAGFDRNGNSGKLTLIYRDIRWF